MRCKGISFILAVVLMASLSSPAIAAENENAFVREDSFVEISDIQEQELIELPTTYAAAPPLSGESRIVSAKLVTVEDGVELDGVLPDTSHERAAMWDWWAYDVVATEYAKDEVLPLNSDVTFMVYIANMGTAFSPATTARIEVSDIPSGGTGLIEGSFTVASCEPYSVDKKVYGYAITVNLVSPPGGHTLSVTINPNGAQAENNNYSNRTEGSFTWGSSSTFIDPAYFDIFMVGNQDSITIPIGQTTQFEFFVANNGNASTQNVPVHVTFYDDDLAYFTTTNIVLSSIPNGYARRFTASIKFMYSGIKNITMEVDPNYEIVDHNRDNNDDSKNFTVTGTQSGMEYGTLGFAYPLPEQWTGHYTRYDNHPGNGLDLNAPEGTAIYSVDSGVVNIAGGEINDSRGYFAVITNKTLDPYNNQPLHTRYLHMVAEPFVKSGQSVQWKQPIGMVGKTGYSLDPSKPVNHLHIDFNSGGFIFQTVPYNEGIDTKLFYPYVNFHLDNDPRSVQMMDDHCNIDVDDMFQEGTYVDGVIIKHIGKEHYEQWLEENLHEEATVYKLVEDFGLSWNELKDILHESIYRKYIENMPS